MKPLMNRRARNRLCLLASTAALITVAEVASAQSADVPTAATTASTETATIAAPGDIIITARRVNESLQRVPLSVTALSTEQLGQRQVLSQADLQRTVPGLTVRSGQSNNEFNYSIRGQSVDLFTGSQAAVLPYINEVQATPFGGSSFYDLGSLQVLKGPQGTLFGRNATGGAVLFGTAKPTNEFEGFVTARGGNYDFLDVSGAINIPIVDDKVLLRIAGNVTRRDGYQYNIYKDRYEGSIRRQSGRVSLTLRPSDGIESATVFQYNHSGGRNLQLETWSAYACGAPGVASTGACLFGPALDGVFGPGAYAQYRAQNPLAQPGGLVEQVEFQNQLGPWRVNTLAPSRHRSKDFLVTNTTSFELSDSLTFKNIAGIQKAKTLDERDAAGSGPYYVQGQDGFGALYSGDGPFRQKRLQYSEEAQLVGKAFDDSLDYIVGAYYAFQRDTFQVGVTNIAVPPFIPVSVNFSDYKATNKTTGIYAQVTKNLSDLTGVDGLKLTGGVRYTWEKVKLEQGPSSSWAQFYNSALNPTLPEQSKSFDRPSWTVGLDWQVTPSLLLYVAHRGSWRSGGFNGTAPPRYGNAGLGGNEFKPEKTHDIEIGEKFSGRLAGMPFRLNVALYNQWIEDVQRVVFAVTPAALSPGGVSSFRALTNNVPKAEVRGVELDTSLTPFSWLEVGGAVAYTDAKFTSNVTTLFGNTIAYGPYGDTPKWSGSGYAMVTIPTSDSFGRVTWRTDFYSQSGQYFSNLANTVAPDTKIPSYTLVNSRVNWDIGDTGISVAGFIKNAFKKTNYSGGISLFPLGINAVLPGEPRTFGVEATVKF